MSASAILALNRAPPIDEDWQRSVRVVIGTKCNYTPLQDRDDEGIVTTSCLCELLRLSIR